MRRVSKGFSGVDTLLFEGMLVPQQVPNDVANDVADDVVDVNAEPTPPSPIPATTPPHQQELIPLSLQDKIAQTIEITKLKQRVRKLEKKRKLKAYGGCIQIGRGITELDADEDVTLEEVDAEVQGRLLESQAQVYHLDLEHAQKVLSMQKTNKAYPAEVEKVLEVVTAAKLMTEVVTTATTTITAASVPKASAPRRRRGVIIQDLKEATTVSLNVQSEVMSKDKGKGILVEEPKPLKRQAQIEQDEAFARKLEAQLNANINWNEVIEQVKRKKKQDNTVMRYQSLKRKPVTKAQAKKNMMVYLKIWLDSKWTSSKKREKKIKEEKSRLSKRKGKNLKQESAKKQKIDEEVEELKTHLKLVPNDEDDVYTEATPLDLKILVVDYQIHTEHNKPYYKIIRADGSHQLFLSLIIMLRNFNREDLEMLWKIV
uniref:Uncharacterized protein n=1 Tax=Tanacetum cinerariifolium TaxID=118510 RepID=A0A699LC54_TANCI|nr:hypothetical protein [Tanacetum cinerariifolium]